MLIAHLALLALRMVVGLTFAAHGAQKAFGWWKGPGPEGWQRAIASMGFQPALFWALLSIAAELGGGLLLAIGLLTPLAASLLIGQSVVIIVKVHLPKGFFSRDGGIEFPLALAAGTVAILGVGAGTFSVDEAIGFALPEPILWLLLAVGLAGGLASVAVTRLAPASTPAPQQR